MAVVTKSMMRLIKSKKKETSKYLTRCDTCGDKLGAYSCGSCGERCCSRHDDAKKRQFVHTHFLPSYWRKCAEIGHVHQHEVHFNDEVDLFDHIASYFVKKCAESRCRSKKYCPACTIDLQFSYCVDCVGISGSTVEKTKHYCQSCVDDGKLVDFKQSRSKRTPTVQKNPFCKNNGGVFQLLCQYHSY